MRHITIIGAGAAGLAAAGTAIKNGAKVTLIEKNARPARKVMITGKGRCNLTNNTDLNGLISAVNTNGRFLYSAFSEFDAADTVKLFESLGVPLKTERGNRVFPVSDKAADIVDALALYAKGAEYISVAAKSLIVENGEVKGVLLENGRTVFSDRVIVATGGVSYPATGSTGDGYKMALGVGHSVTPVSGSLVPLEIHEGFCEHLQGLSLKNVALDIFEENSNKKVYSDFGEMLFTHFGISGPIVLSASAHIKNTPDCKYIAKIDLKPALDEKKTDQRLLKDFKKYANRDIINALDEFLPRKLIPVVIRLSGISPRKKVNEVTKTERSELVAAVKSLTLHITDKRPVEEAIITCGGVNVREVDPKTMGSKICRNLYFAGEVLDVDAYTGGFNLQIAFSTGYVAGKSAAK